MKYVVKKTALYGSSTYGPYGSHQEALEASKELENNTFSECFFTVESITENETDPDKAYESYVCFGDDPWIEGVDFSAFEYAKIKIQEVLKG